MMEKVKKYWAIFVIIVLICSNVVTIVWNIKTVSMNTKATTNNSMITGQLYTSVANIQQWMKDHDVRHEDHNQLHQAERDTP
jgi:hypothetical protein